jgi:hypothetical protein
LRYYSSTFLEGLRKTTKVSVRIASDLAKIQAQSVIAAPSSLGGMSYYSGHAVTFIYREMNQLKSAAR